MRQSRRAPPIINAPPFVTALALGIIALHGLRILAGSSLDLLFVKNDTLETQGALSKALLRLHPALGEPLTLLEMRRELCFANVLSNETCAMILDGGSDQ